MLIILGSITVALCLLELGLRTGLIISPFTILGCEGGSAESRDEPAADEGPGVGDGDLLLITSSEVERELLGWPLLGWPLLEKPFIAESVMSCSMPLVGGIF